MPTYRTGNPIGTASAKDLYDDAQDFDNLMLGSEKSYVDRLGRLRTSFSGFEYYVKNAIANAGYDVIGDYSEKILTSDNYNQVFKYQDEYYKLKPSVTLPYTTTGTTADTWATEFNDGNGSFVAMGDAVLRQALASVVGATMIGLANGMSLQQAVDSGSYISVMWYIPYDLHQYIIPETGSLAIALASAGDLYSYIVQADLDAKNQGKALIFPAGWYPISQSFFQTATAVYGTGMNTYLIPTDSFVDQTWLMQWAPSTGQPRFVTRDMSFNGRGIDYSKRVGGFLVGTGCHSSDVSGLFAAACTYGGVRVNPTTGSAAGGRDIVNLNIQRCYLLDCGGSNYYAGFSVELNSAVSAGGNWTDGSIRNIDISGTQPDLTVSAGPMALTVKQSNSKQLYGVLFERFFTATRMQTHFYMNADNGRSYINACSFDIFKGETHYLPSGSTTTTIVNSYSASVPQIDLKTAGYKNYFRQLYTSGSLLNQGLNIETGQDCVFEGLTFQPCAGSTLMDVNGAYLTQLNIAQACENLLFRDCDLRYILGSPQQTLAWSYMVDKGVMTRWESSQITSSPAVVKPFSFLSALSTNASTSKKYPTNATTYSSDITYSNDTQGRLIMAFPATSNTTDTANAKFPIPVYINQAMSNLPYYYVTFGITMTAGNVSNHYFKLQLFGTSVTVTPDTLNKEYIVNARFTVDNTNPVLYLILGHTAAAASAVSFTLSDLSVTTDRYTYPFNHAKSLLAI